MKIISDLYKPEIACLPIGGHFTMGPYEAAFALTYLLESVKVCYPMHFQTFPLLKGDVPELKSELKKLNNTKTWVVDPYKSIGKHYKLIEIMANKERSITPPESDTDPDDSSKIELPWTDSGTEDQDYQLQNKSYRELYSKKGKEK